MRQQPEQPAYSRGDILETGEHLVIVNPVNCLGTMGAGLALQFARRHPQGVPPYVRACREGSLQPGKVLMVPLDRTEAPTHAVHFPTKLHWRNPSQLEWIRQGLTDMYPKLRASSLTSVALPALGAGLGGLPWPQVEALIREAARANPDIATTIFLPR